MDRNTKIVTRLHEDYMYLKSLGYKVFGVFLQGSQNYNLDYKGSDIDTKAIVLPTLDDIILNTPATSTTLIKEDNSHIDIKDIRIMWDCFKRQNINYLEILFTDFDIVSSNYEDIWNVMCDNAEGIAHYDNYKAVNCIAGVVREKEKALCHPYPTLKDKIDKYGYDNKQLHHIIRCREFLERYIDGVPFKDCLIPTDIKFLIDVKTKYLYSKEEAVNISKQLLTECEAMKNNYIDTHTHIINEDIGNLMQEQLCKAIKLSIMEDIRE